MLNGADSASSTLTVMFISDSRSRMIRTFSVSRNECKTLRSFSRRIVCDRSIPSISITYLYRWHLATSHRCPHITPAVDSPRWNQLWDGERKSSTLSEIRFSVIKDYVLRRVVSSTIGLMLFRGLNGLPCYQYACAYIQRLMFLENVVKRVGNESGKFGRCVLQKFS